MKKIVDELGVNQTAIDEVGPDSPRTRKCGSSSSSSSSTPKLTIKESFRLATKLNPDSCEHKEITKAVTYHIAEDMHPFCLGFVG